MCPKDRAQMFLPFLESYIWARNQAFDAWTHARSRRQCLDPLMECTPQAVRRSPQHLLRSSSGPSMRWYRLLRKNCTHMRLSCCCAARAVQAHTKLRLAVMSAWAALCGPGLRPSLQLPDLTAAAALPVRAARPSSTACIAAAAARAVHSSSSSSSSWYLASQCNKS